MIEVQGLRKNFNGVEVLHGIDFTARDGEIVVALVDNEEATLKYLRKDAGRVVLDPANGAYEAQVYEPHRVQVQGKLAGLLRRYH